jgi:ferredoxin-NADP reductase
MYLDGPYGAASSRIWGASHAALVAAGIGVTPFASVLQALMWRHRAARAVCPRCHHAFSTAGHDHHHALKKVHTLRISHRQNERHIQKSIGKVKGQGHDQMSGSRSNHLFDHGIFTYIYQTSEFMPSIPKLKGFNWKRGILLLIIRTHRFYSYPIL